VGWDVGVGEAEEVVADFGWEVDLGLLADGWGMAGWWRWTYFSWAGLADVGIDEATPEHQHVAALFGQWRDGAPRMAIDHL
jgi:hypothetical protein